MRKLLLCIISVFLIITILIGCGWYYIKYFKPEKLDIEKVTKKEIKKEKEEKIEEIKVEENIKKIIISAAGDCTLGSDGKS